MRLREIEKFVKASDKEWKVCLNQIYNTAKLNDEEEKLGRYSVEYGRSFWELACSFLLPVREITAQEAAVKWKSDRRSIKASFRYANAEQREVVSNKVSNFDENRIVVLDGNEIVDGNHHVLAAVRTERPIKYLNLADLPDDL